MKKLIAFCGFLLFTLVLYATPLDVGPDIPGVFIEQPNDLVTIDNVNVTVESIDFVTETPKLEGWTDDYSLKVNRYEYLFMEADLTFNDQYAKEINYFYREIEAINRPPNMVAFCKYSIQNNTLYAKDGFKAKDKIILNCFWIC